MYSQSVKTSTTILLVVIVTTLLGACSSSPASRYYTLQETVIDSTVSPTRDVSLRVGPIYMPRYLNRPQMVTRGKDNQMNVAEYDRWIEPLERGFTRVLTVNISKELGSDWVHEFGIGNEASEITTLRVIGTVTRFDVDADQLATLSMQWALSDVNVKTVYYVTRSTTTQQASSSSYSDHAEALSNLLAEIAKEITAAIEQQQLDSEDTESPEIN